MVRFVPASAAFLAFAFTARDVAAKPEFVARLPNGASVPGVEALGHVNPEGDGARNQFGKDFDKAGRKWTKALCAMDSDGDGQTNGQELGDPCCEWSTTGTASVRWTEGVSHPGLSSKKSDPSLWAAIDCSGGTGMSNAANSTADNGDAGSAPTTEKSGSAPVKVSASLVVVAVAVVAQMIATAVA
uniref:Temptin Cys/Cys disulfide domain-containing protein n=1 Tax=Globisporangium ultimum (strain ATCC 200006 / CBS 805.95 / DAOM BR144) TaxID=431595 RepID=K3X0X0_GLOUD